MTEHGRLEWFYPEQFCTDSTNVNRLTTWTDWRKKIGKARRKRRKLARKVGK